MIDARACRRQFPVGRQQQYFETETTARNYLGNCSVVKVNCLSDELKRLIDKML
jgi:hypothetical protein